ncbi:MAG: cation-transporting P-type ATPase, partial [Propionibacteriaceae bacterium]|nr:cation-transporting P-type ATPase [Propionibacteriaceae bacterium]
AKVAVEEAQAAGITVRMITGDHVVTAAAIGHELGLQGEGLSGAEFAALSDEEVDSRLDDLSVFGRVTPQDKLRLVQRLQNRGEVVAMTGDAVNDAAAIKQAQIGVAMGSGSEVTKQAAKLVLTDDNFATLVKAVSLGRAVYQKIRNYLTFQMAQLIGLILIFLVASIFNINEGVALTPGMVLILNFAFALFAVIVIIMEPPSEGVMKLPPRDPKAGIASAASLARWLIYGVALLMAAMVPLVLGSDQLSPTDPSAPMTMAFVIVALSTLTTGLQLRRDPESGLRAPWGKGVQLMVWPIVFLILSTQLAFLQDWVGVTSLTGWQWLACIVLTMFVMAVVEIDSALRRHHAVAARPTVEEAVAPARAR